MSKFLLLLLFKNKKLGSMNIRVYQNDIPQDFNLEGDIAIDTETMGLNLDRSNN